MANLAKASRNQPAHQQPQQPQQQQQPQVQHAIERYNQLSSGVDESSPTTTHVPKPLSVDYFFFI